ncbi:MAG: hypothetical protein WBX25_19910 [Rhodomicrobium sp.]
MIAVLSAIGAWFGRLVATLGVSGVAALAFLGPLGPIISGLAGAIGSAISALFEIIASLSKSAEGRIVLAILALGFGFLYLRFHYIQEGRALERPAAFAQGVARGKSIAVCARTRR